jgi:hypothetical protein
MDTANPYASPAEPYGSFAAPPSAVAVSEGTVQELEGTRPWVKFIAILTWIGAGFMVLAALGIMAAGMLGGAASTGMESAAAAIAIGLFYLVFSALMIYPALKMSAYAKWIASLSVSRAVSDLETALQQQRLVWRFWGIIMAIYLVIAVLGVAAAMILPLLMMAR